MSKVRVRVTKKGLNEFVKSAGGATNLALNVFRTYNNIAAANAMAKAAKMERNIKRMGVATEVLWGVIGVFLKKR